MQVVPVVDEGLGNSSYVVDLGDGGALVIDPERDPRPYYTQLERIGLRARFVVETHLHADFVSGGRELAATGAELWASAGARLAHAHRPLHDGEEIDLGGLTLRVIATPGHTPEHMSYLLLDGSEPVALFSGGTLMTGGAARTDLLSPDQTNPLARAAYRSIRQRLLPLPDDLMVYPTHGAGSFCSVGSAAERTTTIGREKASNPLLVGEPDEDTFVERLVASYGTHPPYFLELREVNRRGASVIGDEPATPAELSPTEVEAAAAAGAEVVDVRSVEAFAAGHVPGSISNPWRPSFATWLGWLVSRDTPVVFVVDETIPLRDLVWAALKIGYENVSGTLRGGVVAWEGSGRTLASLPLVDDPATAADHTILDVRQVAEHAAGHVSGALHTELGSLGTEANRITADRLLVHCGHGERATTAASLLRRAGHTDVSVFRGSVEDLDSPVTS